MSLDIKTSAIAPKRHAYANIAQRIGEDRTASRYEEATYDLQATENFHYRPTWDPAHEIYDAGRTQVQMSDWYALLDPRKLYYGTYTISRHKMMERAEAQLDFVEQRNLFDRLSPPAKQIVTQLLLPIRHYEWGANMNNMEIARFGMGTAITQAAAFAAMDRLGMAQLVSRIGLALGPTGLNTTKSIWTEHPTWQPLRRVVENAFVVQDWFELFIAQNFVMDSHIYPFAFTDIDDVLLAMGETSVSLTTEVFRHWYREHCRWVDAIIKRTCDESDENRNLITQWTQTWSAEMRVATSTLENELDGDNGPSRTKAIEQQFIQRAEKIGITLKA